MSLLGANICSGQNFDPGKTDLKKKKAFIFKTHLHFVEFWNSINLK
jgi:hypothetical protein